MIEEFIAYLEQQVGCSLYVWGAQGQTDITERWIRSRESSEANVQRVLALWEKLKAGGVTQPAAFDCSGLILHFLQDEKGFFKSDMSAAGLYNKCAPIARSALRRGDLVFRDNGSKVHHVGVYIGDGTVIEAQGRDMGVTRRKIDAGGAGYWNRCGRLPLPGAEAVAPAESGAAYAAVVGGSVYVRSGRGSDYARLCTAHRGDKLLALPAMDGWCEIAAAVDGRLVKGYMAARYVEPLAGKE